MHFRSVEAQTSEPILFLGTQTEKGSSKGIYACRWNPTTGKISDLHLAAAIEQPTYLTLSLDRKLLFAANELDKFQGTDGGAVSSFHVDSADGKLTHISTVPSLGAGTCHVGVDPSGRTLLCANYGGGSASSFRIGSGGELSPAVSHFQYSGHGIVADRQERPHVHRATVSPGSGYGLFNDLGLDVIHIYKLDPASAELTPHTPEVWHAKPGFGPRALRFHPNGHWAYCVAELNATVTLLHWDEHSGTFTTVQEVSLKPDGFTGRAQPSDIVIDKKGRFAYAACRFYDTISAFSISPQDGKLTLLGRTSAGGKVPRDIALDPSERWFLSANQESDTLSVIARDPATGHLAETATTVEISRPQCIRFL